MKCLIIAFLTFFVIFPVQANESYEFKLKALVRNGELDEAKRVLVKVKTDSELFNRIKGQILTKEEKYLEANKYLERAYVKSPKDQTLFIMAQNALKLGHPNDTIMFLNKVKKDSVPVRLMISQAYWDLNKKEKAFNVVFQKGFEDNELLEKQKYNFLIKGSKLKMLFRQISMFLEQHPDKVEPALFATALLKEKDLFLSEKLFDLAIAKSPKSALLLKERGAFELEIERPKVASSYFVRAAHLNKEYSYEASVTKLLLGEHFEALYHAFNIKDPLKRLKQKFFIYLDQERFEEIITLKEQLARLNMFSDEKITYAFLYSAYKANDLTTFNSVFSSYQVKSQLSKVMKLKGLLEKCSQDTELECVFS